MGFPQLCRKHPPPAHHTHPDYSQWQYFNNYVSSVLHEILPVSGDGFCLINSLILAMAKDHNIIVQFDEAKQLILHTLIDNHQKYVDFHNKRHKCQDPNCQITSSDLLICNMIQFFDTKAFDVDVVDILIQIAADALNLNIHVFQSNHGKTQQLEYMGGSCCHDVFVKFTYDLLFSGLNHYESIIKLCIKEEQEENVMTHEDELEDEDEANAHGMILDEIIPDIGRGKPFQIYLFATMKLTKVESIPNNIDGFKLYQIKTRDRDWTKVTSDHQYFDLKTSS